MVTKGRYFTDDAHEVDRAVTSIRKAKTPLAQGMRFHANRTTLRRFLFLSRGRYVTRKTKTNE